jgi:sterol 14-demethylase
MFAGHHTTSGSAAWTLIEMLRNSNVLDSVVSELDEIYADGRDVSHQALREIPKLEHGIQEALRLHPPLIILMRKVMQDFHYKGYTVPAGKLVGVSPAVSNRMPECFPEPDRYDPDRYGPGREEDKQAFAWIPFGAGRHRCVGSAFAMMQIKAIFSELLQGYVFELAQSPDSYQNDHSKMVVQLKKPCRVRYRRRKPKPSTQKKAGEPGADSALGESFEIRVDRDLCQGHGVCADEAPGVFEVDRDENQVVLLVPNPDAEMRQRVALAIKHCPTRALFMKSHAEER